MEVFRSEEYYIFVQEEVSLWWSRITGDFLSKSAWDLSEIQDIECLGITPVIIGKIEHDPIYEPRLMIVKEASSVGTLYDDHIIYKIKSICLLTLGTEDVELNLSPCKKHTNINAIKNLPQETTKVTKKEGKGLFENSLFVNKTWGVVKSAGNTIKNTTQHAAAIATSQVKHTVNKTRDFKDKERLERRITEELHKVFDDTDSFYFSKTADITHTLQRLGDFEALSGHGARWKNADDRFFWNKHMLKDILDMGSPQCDPWVIPVIQGHVKVRRCEVDAGECSRHLNTESLRGGTPGHRELFILSLISRRSRYRAGTRYKRRGIDDVGHVANYVETEQCLMHQNHRVSFVQVRGSAPLYWSQPGHKYRPPPRLDKGEAETQVVFNKHFEMEMEKYGPVCIVNLVEQAGREKVIWEAFSNHIYSYNSPNIVYATFDFHEYCRGMHFENVSVLINAILDIITDMGYCWRDPQGYICKQTGVFRVNCIDCLDRTNVVQTAIAKAVLEMQVTRLGLSGPDWPLPAVLRTALHDLWADNGDVISKQYAGTNALKGDYTRTGERKFTGMMKDGMNSANRYYIQHFMDTFRQCVLDLMLGNTITVQDLDRELDVFNSLKTVGNIASDVIVPAVLDLPPQLPDKIPGYFIQTVRDEILLINLAYGISRYYLSRFKDTFRQATIDLMLGQSRATDFMVGQDGVDGEAEGEGESNCSPEHVKHLIEDCKKLLVSDIHNVVGAWGLIDADLGTGDPHETEMDSILILNKDSYLVADYDDQSDRITGFQKLELKDVTLIEFGTLDVASQMSLTSLKSNLSLGSSKRPSDGALCIRIHYKHEGQDGYFHTFRSTNLRFFNNMAVFIKTAEEIHESLRSICECFLIAMDVGGLPRVPFHHGGKLERKKSKVRQNSDGGKGHSSLYLELSGLPGLTRNLSETQLAIKSVGSKALTNMSEQFSKLNRLGNTFNTKNKNDANKPAKPNSLTMTPRTKPTTFSLGKSSLKVGGIKKHTRGNASDCTSSDYSSDEDDKKTNIFEPTLDNFENCQRYVGDNPLLKSTTDGKNDTSTTTPRSDSQSDFASEAYLIENPLYSSKIDTQTSGNDVYVDDYLVDTSDDTAQSNTSKKRPELSLDMTLLDKTPTNHDSASSSTNPFSAQSGASFKLNPFNMDGENARSGTMGSEYLDAGASTARSTTPEITINFDSDFPNDNRMKSQPPSTLKLNQKLSHSSGEVDVTNTQDDMALLSGNDSNKYDHSKDNIPVRSNSQHDINLNISSSQSESALKQLKNLTSPVASVTKDIVLSPFSKFAKGMQNLGANLDPRKIKGGSMVRQITEQQYEEHRKLQEKWRKCNTRLIAL